MFKNLGLRNVIRHAGLPLRRLGLASGVMLLDSLATLATPLVIGLISALIIEQDPPLRISLGAALAIWAGLVLLQALLRFHSTQLLGTTAAVIGAQLRLRTYEHIQALPLTFFHERHHGDILSLLSEDIDRVSAFIMRAASELPPHLLTVAGAMVIVLLTDPLTGAIALAIIPAMLLAVRKFSRATRQLSLTLANKSAQHTALTEENLRTNPLIKAFSREHLERQRYDESNRGLLEAEIAHLRSSNRVAPSLQAISGLAVIGLVWIGAYRIEQGSLSAPQLISLLMYAFILFRPLHAIGGIYSSLQSARGAAIRLQELLSISPEPGTSGQENFTPPGNAIRFDNIHFAYPDRPKLFDGLSLDIPAGQLTVITGENGSGKTTLMHLLLRFIDPRKGQILLDQQPLDKCDLKGVRQHIAYVPQNVMLVSGSIAENIRYGLPSASDQDVYEVAVQSLVTEFSDGLPQQLETQVGPGGMNLSGGQKQRIAFARALLKNAEVIILDEPTAMYSLDSERHFVDLLKTRLAGRTVIIITHRPALLAIADKVLTLTSR